MFSSDKARADVNETLYPPASYFPPTYFIATDQTETIDCCLFAPQKSSSIRTLFRGLIQMGISFLQGKVQCVQMLKWKVA